MSLLDIFWGDLIYWYFRLATTGPTFINFGPFTEKIVIKKLYVIGPSSAPFDQYQIASGSVVATTDAQFSNGNLLWSTANIKNNVPGTSTPNTPNLNGSNANNTLIDRIEYRINKPIFTIPFYVTIRIVSSTATGSDKTAALEFSWIQRPIPQLIGVMS